MKIRELLWIGLRTAAGVCSLFVSIRGVGGAYGIDFRVDTLVSTIYVVFPVASFFIFLFVKAQKLELILHAIVAIGYLGTFSILNWRTCAELGYCGSVASTVFETLKIKPVLAAFGVIVFSFAASFVDARRSKTADHTSSK
ncbi:MAG: hypothetical protein ABSE96_21730 [Terracidiphilus sp.]|jgi:hypothetical protein